MTPSPSGLRDLQQHSSPVHDAMHLWLNDSHNQIEIISKTLDRHDLDWHQIKSKHSEVPIYGYNRFLLGIIDCVITADIPIHWISESVYSFRFDIHLPPNIQEYNGEVRALFLVEIKPKLDSISSTIGQIKAYRDAYGRPEGVRMLKTVLLTTDDQTSKFDNLFKSEDINVYRIPKSEIDELL